jgi:hypothetical protein
MRVSISELMIGSLYLYLFNTANGLLCAFQAALWLYRPS